MILREDGQALTEYALIAFALFIGGAFALMELFPAAIEAWSAYIGKFNLTLSLPIL